MASIFPGTSAGFFTEPMLAFPTGTSGKIAWTAVVVVGVPIVATLLRAGARAMLTGDDGERRRFRAMRTIHLASFVAICVGLVAIWTGGSRTGTPVLGWIAAGLAIALHRVVTSFAGYVTILRGGIFAVGDRVTIGGVRGDVVALGFMQTTMMELGQQPGGHGDHPSVRVRDQQYSGRVVHVTNDRIFDGPVYNFTRDFPYLWEEMTFPIRYEDDYQRVERLLLEVARRHTAQIVAEARPALGRLHGTYYLADRPVVEPQVYVRLTDNWVELSLRFLSRDRGARALRDAISRDVLAGLAEARIGIASTTYTVVQMPPIEVWTMPARSESDPPTLQSSG